MADVDDIIDYIKTLRKGFDKDLFQRKIDELANAVDTTGLVYEDFHTLFKVWLHLSLPISKWVNMGSSLAPPDLVEEKTVQYALRWLLVNVHDQTNSPRVGFLLDWLTVAMDCESIDMTALDSGYDIFYNMLTFEASTIHAAKLVYTLTKPIDVTRKKVIQLLEYASKREANKSLLKQLQVILGLFKSYKPDCVPEDIPAFPIYTAFKKLNERLYTRFKNLQNRRNKFSSRKQHLVWINPINSEKRRNIKVEPLVPNLEFINKHRKDGHGEQTNFFDFSEPAALLQASALGGMSRPARLRALLCHGMGNTLLALLPHAHHAFFSRELRELLSVCFMEWSPYSYAEQADLLQKLVEFQCTMMQGVPAVTGFLAQYLPFWNEMDYFPQILELCEWVSACRPEEVALVSERLAAACLRAQPLRQCAILRSLTHMYANLVYASTRSRQHFLPHSPPAPAHYGTIIPALARDISTLCHKLLQVDPGCVRVLHMVSWCALHRARAEGASGAPFGALPTHLTLALPLLQASPGLIENVAELIILYKKNKANAEINQLEFIGKYLQDLLNCLYSEEALSGRHKGLVFQSLHPQLVDTLGSLMPDTDAKLSLRNHIAFAPLTYLRLLDVNNKDADNKMLFHGVLQSEFPHLGLLMKRALPELRHH